MAHTQVEEDVYIKSQRCNQEARSINRSVDQKEWIVHRAGRPVMPFLIPIVAVMSDAG